MDSDHDGLLDNVEALVVNPGMVLEGSVDDPTDSDRVGLADLFENDNELILIDTDGDGDPNFIDIDSDNDQKTDLEDSDGRDILYKV